MTKLTCIAPHCTASAKTNKDLKFHRLPCDKIRRKEWIILCQRLDLINESKDFFKDKSVCSLHFDKSMYGNKKLKRLATPSPSLIGNFENYQDSSTQTCESINIVQPTLVKIESAEVTASGTQTEDVFLCTKTENDNIDTQSEEHKMECNEIKIENVLTVKAEDAKPQDLKTNKKAYTSTDSEDESEDEMSIEEFLQANDELENQIREVLKKKNLPQIPINNSKSNVPVFLINKEVQTDEVTVYDIPKNNLCFQQCLRCGKNLNRLNLDLKPDRLVTLKEFESACERFLSPTFCNTVKNQIKLEQLQNKTDQRLKDRRYVVFQ